jgi:predicted component of type VI protein secretion system
MLHHLALSQAALEGTKALLDELSPANIEGAQVRTPSMLSRLGLAEPPERALWETFADRHAELAAAGRSFRELFGEQFSRVYAAHWPIPGSGASL